jgi:hypothetical protein
MEPLDHPGTPPQPDATDDMHSELDTLARVALSAAETISRAAARRSTREAQAIERAATAELADAADRAEQAKAGLTTGTASAIPATGPVTIGDLLAASHPDLVAPSSTAEAAPVTFDLDQPATTLTTTLDAATTSTGTPPTPAEPSALGPTVEVPVTIQDLLDASHPLSAQEEPAAAQAAAGTVPVEAARSYELTSTAELGLG